MAQTFTGLKLQGAQGRFGNTEVSDVIGILAMPDGKVRVQHGCGGVLECAPRPALRADGDLSIQVVSGCEWGNILIWEAGLIKVEVTKKGRKGCHDAPITQFEYFNGELVSLGEFSVAVRLCRLSAAR